jgi:restriction system protein
LTDDFEKNSFEDIWKKHVMPLNGQILTRKNGDANQILDVDWSGIRRITSNGKKKTIKIEIFKEVIHYLIEHKEITRSKINEDYDGYASSGICLILSQVPFIEYLEKPSRLVWNA